MTNPVRLIIARTEEYALALNLDTGRQCLIDDPCEIHGFYSSFIGLSHSLSDQYNQGLPAAVGMRFNDWQRYIGNFELTPEDSDFVWLTLCADGKDDEYISAVCLTDHREAIVPPGEVPNFWPDCIGFSADRFNQGYGTVCRMTKANWEAWLEHFEVCELSEEVAALSDA